MKPPHLCRHLRTKKMYIQAEADEVLSPQLDPAEHTSHCWCNRTLTETGQDDRQVSFSLCNRSRKCFEE